MSSDDVRGWLSDLALVSAVDAGRQHPPTKRALVLLRHAFPASEMLAADAWSIGQLEARLLDVHVATFGKRISGLITCPHCGAQLDVSFDADDVRQPHGDAREEFELTAADSGYYIRLRLPSCADLMAAAACSSQEDGRNLLADRCILAGERDGVPVSVATLPDNVMSEIGGAMAARDPQSDVRLDLTCPTCRHIWQVVFDAAVFLWQEVAARVLQLVADVHALARAYGWREADILAMPEGRRQMYLDLVSG